MKRYGNLYQRILDMDNIEYAYEKAKRHKAWQDTVQKVERRKDEYLKRLQDSLRTHRYKTSPYREKKIYEPKERTIYILPFYPDRIAQHAVMNIVSPIWDRFFIDDSYACREGKGQHKGSKRCMQFVRRNRYCLQCDISKFYPSIDHEILMRIIKRKIKDKETLDLLEEIVTSIGGTRNVPIGNYTSQWFGNLYMNEMDMFIKHKHHVRDYIRYCDDFLLFSNSKDTLRSLSKEITEFAAERLKLRLSKCALFPTAQGVDFLGYRHFPNGKILVRKSTAKRQKRKVKAIPYLLKHGKITKEAALSSLCSIKGWLAWGNTRNLSLSLGLEELEKWIRAFPIERTVPDEALG